MTKYKFLISALFAAAISMQAVSAYASDYSTGMTKITPTSTESIPGSLADDPLGGNNVTSTENGIYATKEYNSLPEGEIQSWFTKIEEKEEKDIMEKIESGELKSAALNTGSGTLYLTFEPETTYKITKPDKSFINYLRVKGITVTALNFKEDTVGSVTEKSEDDKVAESLFIILFIIAGLVIYWRYHERQAVTAGGSGSTGPSSENGAPKVCLDDVEGVEGLKADVLGIVDFLKNPDKYRQIGARVPKGIILYGPPGTGKTLLAKAVAGEAGVPFLSAVGSDFVEKYVGVGASRVRKLYSDAKKKAPCIVFIDEIDAVAGKRGNDSNTERDQTINALLAELDGFDTTKTVVTICATNRLDMLDDAFQRAGRFDLKLAVGLPDKKARFNILKIHGRNKKFDDTVNFETIAAKTQQFSGAELEALLNEAALEAVRSNRTSISNNDIEEAFFKIVMKGNKKKRKAITETNRVIAWHEAGHTLATKLLTDDNVPSVTIVGSASGAGGVTFRTPKDDVLLHSRKYLENLIKVMYAGRAAEELYFGNDDDVTTGASQDIKQATGIIREYLSIYGMGDMGMLDLSQFQRDYSIVIKEASDMAKRLYEDTRRVLYEHLEILQVLAEELLNKETLDEAAIDRIICEAGAA